MKFSVIIPSYNQPAYIEDTLQSIRLVKTEAEKLGHTLEVLLFDSNSPAPMPGILEKHKALFDVFEVKKDKGQFDAINKGIAACTGAYWTWLNTDDTFDTTGIIKTMQHLAAEPDIDYCYGAIDYTNEKGEVFRSFPARSIDYTTLVTHTPGIFQQGSFFRKPLLILSVCWSLTIAALITNTCCAA